MWKPCGHPVLFTYQYFECKNSVKYGMQKYDYAIMKDKHKLCSDVLWA
uniref:Uncharacterized protein n=1 Tax=Arundo donax TaxID=35708 RepID=A0A0A8ZSF8_ARUDO